MRTVAVPLVNRPCGSSPVTADRESASSTRLAATALPKLPVVKSGDVVRMKVPRVDATRKRIALALRLDDEIGTPDSADN